MQPPSVLSDPRLLDLAAEGDEAARGRRAAAWFVVAQVLLVVPSVAFVRGP